MTRTVVAVGLVAASVTVIGSGRSPQLVAPGIVFHVSVTGENSLAPIVGLAQDDFEVWSADQQRLPIRSFATDPAPITGVVLVDATWTTANAMAPFVANAQPSPVGVVDELDGSRPTHRASDLFMGPIREGVLARLRDGDRIRVGSISRQIRLSSVFTGEASALSAALREVLQVPETDRYGPTPIWDAIDTAVSALESEPGQRAILLVTDGMATGNRRSLADVTKRAALARIAVYIVQEPSTLMGPAWRLVDRTSNPWLLLMPLQGPPPEVTLEQLAEATGGTHRIDASTANYRKESSGRYYVADQASTRPGRLEQIFAQVVGQLHRTYTVGFSPTLNDGAVHSVSIRVRKSGVQVRAPTIYQASSQ